MNGLSDATETATVPEMHQDSLLLFTSLEKERTPEETFENHADGGKNNVQSIEFHGRERERRRRRRRVYVQRVEQRSTD